MKVEIINSTVLLASERWDAGFFIVEESSLESKHKLIPIGELVNERKSFIEPQEYPNHIFNYIGLEHISQNTRVLVDFEPRPGITVKSRSKIFRKGDLLYGRLRPTLNKVLYIDNILSEGICSTEIFVLSPKTQVVNPIFLAEILTSEWVLKEIKRLAGGATLPRLNIKDFLEINIPVPDIDIQNKIAEFVEKSRTDWKNHSSIAEKMPESIKNTIEIFLTEGGELKLDQDINNVKTWANPLPDTELRGN